MEIKINIAENRKCPISGSEKISLVFAQKLNVPEDYFFSSTYKLVQSQKTGLVYADALIKDNILENHYSKDSKYDPNLVKSLIKYPKNDIDRYDSLYECCKKYINEDSKIIDVGFGNGGLFKSFLSSGVTVKQLYGIDPSPISQTIAKTAYNVNSFLGGIDDLKKYNEKFDMIILSHVVEHLLNPRVQMNSLLESLSPDGKIYIEVPNASKFHEYVDLHGPYQEINTEHINHWTEQSLKNLAHFSGFKCLESCERVIQNEAGDYPVLHQVWEKGQQTFKFDSEILESMQSYLKKSNILFNEQIATIKKNTPVYLFGIGEFSYKILANIDNKHIKGLVDKSPKKIGKKINNLKVLSPQILKKLKNEKIFISSFVSKQLIKDDLLSINKDLIVL